MSTIPARQVAAVNPVVLGAGGNALDINGLFLTASTRAPIGQILSFPSPSSVEDYFGSGSTEALEAAIYFLGFDNSSKKPGALLFTQYNASDVSAYLRGGDISALSLAGLQAISGSLNIVIDGVARNVSSYNLSAASSFSSAAGIIQTALIAAAPAAATLTGSIGGIVTASAGAAFTGSGSGTNLTVSAIAGVLHIGAAVTGTGVPAGTYVVSQSSGSAGSNGVYVTNHATTSSGDSLVATSNTLDVTGVTSGTLQPTDVISGSGVTVGTTVLAQISGSPGGIGLYTISSQQHVASTAVTSLSEVLNVTAVGSGTIETGAVLAGTAVTSGTKVTGGLTGTGSTGTYTVDRASTTISEAITASAASPVVTYDSTSGAFVITSGITGASSSLAYATGTTAATLLLTSATGAVLSQGAVAAVPATFMNAVVGITTNWVTFMTLFNPDSGDALTVREAFAAWKDSQNDRYAYVCADALAAAAATLPATGSLGYALTNNGDSGTALNWAPDYQSAMDLCAFVCGAAASINFDEPNGRITFAFKAQSGIAATVTDETSADNLAGNPQAAGRGNGYNFYGAYGTANANFIWYQRGFVTGDYEFLDSYINQIWLNNRLQLAILNFMKTAKSIPYTPSGETLIEQVLADPITAALSFGACAPGTITSAQIADVNQDAGTNIADTLQTQGYYLQILPADGATRARRGSPPCKFWYLDRGSIQAITLSSIAVL